MLICAQIDTFVKQSGRNFLPDFFDKCEFICNINPLVQGLFHSLTFLYGAKEYRREVRKIIDLNVFLAFCSVVFRFHDDFCSQRFKLDRSGSSNCK